MTTSITSTSIPQFYESLPVLEPLSRATEIMLKPCPLDTEDYLLIELDLELKWFFCKARCLRDLGLTETTDQLDENDIVVTLQDGSQKLVNRRRQPSRSAAVLWYKRIPEHKPKYVGGYGDACVAATDTTALVIHHQWNDKKIVFMNDDTRTMYRFLLTRFLKQTSTARMMADFKRNRVRPTLPKDFTTHPEENLRQNDYQEVGLLAGLEQEGFADFMQQGTGKTPMNIARLCLEAQRTMAGRYGDAHMMRVLIVAPRQVRTNWVNEIKRFSVVPGKVGVIRGGEMSRARMMLDILKPDAKSAYAAVVSSYQSVERTWNWISRIPWDLVIVDEGHYLKNRSTQRFKSIIQLRDISMRRRLLTGTPITNSIMDLWSQLEFLGEGLSGFISFKAFKDFYGKWKRTETKGIDKLIGLRNVPLIQERLARLSFMISKQEARLNLPEKVYDIYEVEMTKKQSDYYRQVATQLALEIEAEEAAAAAEGKRLTAEHILTKMLRLAQITNGFIKWDTIKDAQGNTLSGGEREQIDGDVMNNPKIQGIIEMLTEEGRDPLGKTIIWSHNVEDIRALQEALASANIQFRAYWGGTADKDRDQMVRDFNWNPDVKVFIANQMTAAEGLNLLGYDWDNPDGPALTTYTDHEIVFGQNWSPVLRSQLEDRCHRKGTRMNVRITDLVVPGTIDEEIRARVLGKHKMAMEVSDLREIMTRILSPEGLAEADGEGE